MAETREGQSKFLDDFFSDDERAVLISFYKNNQLPEFLIMLSSKGITADADIETLKGELAASVNNEYVIPEEQVKDEMKKGDESLENNLVQRVRDYVEDECKKPDSHYGYDVFSYHFTSMVAYAEKLADELGADKEIVQLAGWLHDIGSIICGRENHHLTGAEIAGDFLMEQNYPPERVELIKNCIRNHRGSQNRERISLEEQIIAEADAMSNFDNVPGLFKAAYIYEGLDQGQAQVSVREKLKRKWKQLSPHSQGLIKAKYDAVMILLA